MTHYWFIAEKNKRGSKLILFTFLLAFVVITLGAYTRLTNAGLSCPDWPHCYGYMTAPHTPSQLQEAAKNYPASPVDVKRAWTEMTHRYFAGLEAILILILSFSTLLAQGAHRQSKTISFALIGLLCIQVLLGMWTVTEKLKPIIVISHLLTGISILSILWWAFINSKSEHYSFSSPPKISVTPWLLLAFGIVLLQITLGGWVSTHYAGLACVDFPYCNGEWFPKMNWSNMNTDLITIHMAHRFGAFITAFYLGILSIKLLNHVAYRTIALFILSLITLQITLGILNIIWLRPVIIAIGHQMIAIILLLTVITALIKSLNSEQQYAQRLA